MSVTAISNEEAKTAAASRAFWIKQARQWHLYLGTLFAPSILFFALTGAAQLFGLHEGHPGDAYQPPSWLVKLGALHKKQTMAERRGPPPGAGLKQMRPPEERADAGKRPQGEPRKEGRKDSTATVVLKWFFLASSIGLVLSTILGIYMAFKFNRSRVLIWGLLLGGTAIPAALVMLMTGQ